MSIEDSYIFLNVDENSSIDEVERNFNDLKNELLNSRYDDNYDANKVRFHLNELKQAKDTIINHIKNNINNNDTIVSDYYDDIDVTSNDYDSYQNQEENNDENNKNHSESNEEDFENDENKEEFENDENEEELEIVEGIENDPETKEKASKLWKKISLSVGAAIIMIGVGIGSYNLGLRKNKNNSNNKSENEYATTQEYPQSTKNNSNDAKKTTQEKQTKPNIVTEDTINTTKDNTAAVNNINGVVATSDSIVATNDGIVATNDSIVATNDNIVASNSAITEETNNNASTTQLVADLEAANITNPSTMKKYTVEEIDNLVKYANGYYTPNSLEEIDFMHLELLNLLISPINTDGYLYHVAYASGNDDFKDLATTTTSKHIKFSPYFVTENSFKTLLSVIEEKRIKMYSTTDKDEMTTIFNEIGQIMADIMKGNGCTINVNGTDVTYTSEELLTNPAAAMILTTEAQLVFANHTEKAKTTWDVYNKFNSDGIDENGQPIINPDIVSLDEIEAWINNGCDYEWGIDEVLINGQTFGQRIQGDMEGMAENNYAMNAGHSLSKTK